MKIVEFDHYRKLNKPERRETELTANNDNAGGRLRIMIQNLSVFRSVTGEFLTPTMSDSGVVVKIAAGYPHRFS